MTNYNIVLKELRQRIQKSPKTRALGLSREGNWKQREFDLLATAIGESLDAADDSLKVKNSVGLTISVTTLERIFKHGYRIKENIDKRQEKTLRKLCIYLGYEDLASFVQELSSRDKPAPSLEDLMKVLIENAAGAEFQAYQSLPKIDLSELKKYFVEDAPALLRIHHILQVNREKHWVINNAFNPSYQRVLDCEILKEEKDRIQVKTKENWYLRWYDSVHKTYPFIYDELNSQFYQLIKIEGVWKVELNQYDSKKAHLTTT